MGRVVDPYFHSYCCGFCHCYLDCLCYCWSYPATPTPPTPTPARAAAAATAAAAPPPTTTTAATPATTLLPLRLLLLLLLLLLFHSNRSRSLSLASGTWQCTRGHTENRVYCDCCLSVPKGGLAAEHRPEHNFLALTNCDLEGHTSKPHLEAYVGLGPGAGHPIQGRGRLPPPAFGQHSGQGKAAMICS